MRLILIALMSLFIGLSSANATTLTDIKEKEILTHVENYLNNMMTMEADFTQASSNGNIIDGKLYISKPKKLRMEYNQPMEVSIIGDGDYIIYIDKDKSIVSIQKNAKPLDETSLPSEAPAKYVLEINAGLSDQWQIERGDRIEFTKL